jgi:hypothetical protein
MSSQRSKGSRSTRGQARTGRNSGKSRIHQVYQNQIDRGVMTSDQQAILPNDAYDVIRSTMPPTGQSIPKSLPQLVHWFRSNYEIQFGTSITVPTFGALNFTFNQINDYASYVAIFDEYAIIEATVRFIPVQAPGTSGSPLYGEFLSVLDHDDSNLPASLQTIREYSTLLTTKGNIGQTRVVYPRLAEASYSGAFTSFTNTRAWVDAGSPSVQHYGIKWGADTSTSPILYNISINLVFCCRSTR